LKFLPSFILALAFHFSFGEALINLSDAPKKFIELTTTDITNFKDLNGKNISIFGIHLSMKTEELLNLVEKNGNFILEKDIFNENRFYVYDKEFENGKKIALAYLYLGEKDTGIKEIILYKDIHKYLVGNSKYLFTYEIFNKNSYIVKYFTGFPSHRELILDIPILGLKSYAYYYPDKNFIVTRNLSDTDATITLSLVLKMNFKKL
jgi:hypothetical protein